jgi:hypothetical protein
MCMNVFELTIVHKLELSRFSFDSIGIGYIGDSFNGGLYFAKCIQSVGLVFQIHM